MARRAGEFPPLRACLESGAFPSHRSFFVELDAEPEVFLAEASVEFIMPTGRRAYWKGYLKLSLALDRLARPFRRLP